MIEVGTAVDRDGWVAMELAPRGDQIQNFHTGPLVALTGRSSKAGMRGTILRILWKGLLTKTRIGELEAVADRFLGRSVHARARQVVEGYWTSSQDEDLYFLAEPGGQRVRAIHRDRLEADTQAWAVLNQVSRSALDAGVLVELVRSDPRASLEAEWAELRRALDLVITPEPAPPVQVSATDPTVIIQTDPAEARRATLLALNWPSSIEVGQRAGSRSPGQWTKARRDGKQLLGVWDVAAGTYRHPDFQFDPDGQVKAEVKRLLAAMAEHPRWTAENDPNGWRRTYWLYQPRRDLSKRAVAYEVLKQQGGTAALSGSPEASGALMDELLAAGRSPEDQLPRTPAEVFLDNPEFVIALARKAAREARPDMDVEAAAHGA
jgi:hypothetical protein